MHQHNRGTDINVSSYKHEKFAELTESQLRQENVLQVRNTIYNNRLKIIHNPVQNSTMRPCMP